MLLRLLEKCWVMMWCDHVCNIDLTGLSVACIAFDCTTGKLEMVQSSDVKRLVELENAATAALHPAIDAQGRVPTFRTCFCLQCRPISNALEDTLRELQHGQEQINGTGLA